MAAEVVARPSAEPLAVGPTGVLGRFSVKSGEFDHNSTYCRWFWSEMSRNLERRWSWDHCLRTLAANLA